MTKKITVISTGGTIATGVNPKTGETLPLNGEELVRFLPSLTNLAEIGVINFCNKPGTHMTFEDILGLSRVIRDLFTEKRADGVVVTHGTDTLEETAYALDLLIPRGSPVIVTGAMRKASEISYDGPVNLYSSILTAAADNARERGVMVVFNNEVHLARNVTKTSATQVNTFRSPLLGPVGFIHGQKLQFLRTPEPGQLIPVEKVTARVELIKFALDLSTLFLTAVKESEVEGLVIEGAGVGNVSIPFADAIRGLIQAGKVIVLTSRCYEGLVLQESYDFPASDKRLHEMGAIMAPGLNGPKARIKLTLALSLTRELDKVRELFNEPVKYG